MRRVEHNFKEGRKLVRVQTTRNGTIKAVENVEVAQVYKTGNIISTSNRDRRGKVKDQFRWTGECFERTRVGSSYTPLVRLYPATKRRFWEKQLNEQEEKERIAFVHDWCVQKIAGGEFAPTQLSRIVAIINE